tara:strand:+ start:506 stop:832 length:327 start_codon:yes stop_codon:yes gene_type:complete
MTTLNDKIRIYLSDNGKVYKDESRNYELENDGSGDRLVSWNVSGLAEPTAEQLDALVSRADTDISNRNVRYTRKKSYGDIGDQLDEIFKDIDAWKARIQQIKTDNPKS